MTKVDDQLLLLFLLAHICLQTVSEIVVVEGRHHDILEVIVGVSIVHLLEGFNGCISVDVDSDAMLVGQHSVSLNFEVNVVYSFLDLDEPVGAFVVSFHILTVVVLAS